METPNSARVDLITGACVVSVVGITQFPLKTSSVEQLNNFHVAKGALIAKTTALPAGIRALCANVSNNSCGCFLKKSRVWNMFSIRTRVCHDHFCITCRQ